MEVVPAGVGRGRPRRDPRQRRGAAGRSSRPAAVLAVVKADGYGHGAVPVAPGRARSRRDDARGRARRGRRRSSATPASTRRSSCSRSRCRPRPSVVAAPPHARRLHGGRHRGAREGGRRRRGTRAAPGAPQGRHRHAPRRLPRPPTRSSSRRSRRRTASCASKACGPTSPSPTSPTTRTPPQQLARFDAVRAALRRARSPTRARARGEHRGRARVPGARATTSCARHRHLRHRAGRRRSPAARRAAPGAVGEGARVVREAAARRRRALLRPALPTRAADAASRPCRSATATACPRNLARGGRRGARRRPPPPIAGTVTMDQLMVDVGDDPASTSATRSCSSAARATRGHRGRVGRSASARSRTRSCAASARASRRAGSGRERDSGAPRGGRGRRGGGGCRVRRRRGSSRGGCASAPDGDARGGPRCAGRTSRSPCRATTAARSTSSSVGRRADDRALARCHAVGAHLGPPARVAAAAGFRVDRVRPSRSWRVDARRDRSLASTTSAKTSAACSTASTSTTPCSSGTRWAASRCSRSWSRTRVAAERVEGHRCCSRRSPGAALRPGCAHGCEDSSTGSVGSRPTSRVLWASPNLGFFARAGRLRARSEAEPRRARPPDDARRAAATRAAASPRALLGLDLTARLPEIRTPDAGDRRHRRRDHAAGRGPRASPR